MDHHVVSREKWVAARRKLLEKEKAHSRVREELTRARQSLPRVKLGKDYVFAGPDGRVAFGELFDGKSQLIVQHFMFAPDWDEGCVSCTFMADHIDPAVVHLAHRDTAFAAVSRAPVEKLLAYKERMGWGFEWVSSEESEFNYDFHVSFSKEDAENGTVYYNYREGASFPSTEAPGMSVFAKDVGGQVYHTYSRYDRGCEDVMTTYNLLDYVPKGRDEKANMDWLRRKDRYDNGEKCPSAPR